MAIATALTAEFQPPQYIALPMAISTVSDEEISNKSELMDADEQSDDSDDDPDTRMQHRVQSLRTSINSSIQTTDSVTSNTP